MSLTIEHLILGAAWLLTALALWRWVPRTPAALRKAQVAFLIKQLMTWLFGLVVVEWGLLSYPIHEFEHANKTSFTFEFFVYPAICAIYNIHFPSNRSYLYKFLYTAAFATPMACLELLLEHYTLLIRYIHWSWYWTWLTLLATFCLSRTYVKWFFRDTIPKQP